MQIVKPTPEIIADIEAAAKERGMGIMKLLARAGINYGNWWRWKKGGSEPTLPSLRKIEAILNEETAHEDPA